MPTVPEDPAPIPSAPPEPSLSASPVSEAGGHASHDDASKSRLIALSIGALGVVYGDIGTSPLYALRECFLGSHPIDVTRANVLGVLSLIFWALTIIVSIKYLVFIMRADNRGEGGILSLMALAGRGRPRSGRSHKFLVPVGLFGAALLYGDGVITPAISVLSAVEGLDIATPAFTHYIVPITLVILGGLFVIQFRGTASVGRIFGPVMLVWFVTIGLLGLRSLVQAPEVLSALSPTHAIAFFLDNGWHAYLVLGGVFLAVTGGEALYADMGHFGRTPIRYTWFAVALPALLLNYLGQGALLLTRPGETRNPFYLLAPEWAMYPLLVLSTLAAVIASQALISASFSLTRQAVQLGYCPRVQIKHTSSREIGQIYVPAVNWMLAAACGALVLGFRTSSNLAAAYGIAVTCTMAITTILFFFVLREQWNWPLWKALGLCGTLLFIDLAFLGANALKILEGGWVPLAVALALFFLMETWKWGRTQLSERLRQLAMPLDLFLETTMRHPPTRVPGTAVFMSGNQDGVPPSMLHNLKHNKVLHERVVLLTLVTEEIPTVSDRERLKVEELVPGIWRMVAHYGFMEGPNVPELLELARKRYGLEFKMMQTTFFLGREALVVNSRRGFDALRQRIFQSMSLNSRSATAFFHLPPNRVIELGAQIEL